MMRILKSDIDNLIEVASCLRSIADDFEQHPATPGNKELNERNIALYRGMCHRVRKIYLLLLWAEQQDEWPLHRLCRDDIPDNSSIIATINTLCPSASSAPKS